MAEKKRGWAAVHEKKLKKAIKKAHAGYIAVVALSLVIGFVIGYFICSALTANDCFELIGQKETVVAISSELTYEDPGIKCISFGKDVSDSVTVKTNMTKTADGKYTADTSEPTEYYIIYTVTEGRCKGLTLYRTFTVSE